MENRQRVEQYGRPVRPTALPAIAAGITPQPPQQITRPTLPNVLLNTESTQSVDRDVVGPSHRRRRRKERGPNWTPSEVLILISAKRDLYLQELDTPDPRDLMKTETSKWVVISNAMNAVGFSPCRRDGPSCKTKWNQLYSDYKKIADYFSKTGRNVPDYWDLSVAARQAALLPRYYSQEFFEAIHEWCGFRPQINPPHVRDLLSPTDANFKTPEEQNADGIDSDTNSEEDEAVRPSQQPIPIPISTDGSSQQQSGRRTSNMTPSRPSIPNRLPARSSAFTGVPVGVTPHVLSSSNTANRGVQARLGNTGVRQKNLFGHAIIADATKATGIVMASQMKDIADASLQVERTKIEIHRQLFSEQMAYQRERDRLLQENAMAVQENARLAILKQQDMVQCLVELTKVLGSGLTGRGSACEHHQAVPPQYTATQGQQVRLSVLPSTKAACATPIASHAQDLSADEAPHANVCTENVHSSGGGF